MSTPSMPDKFHFLPEHERLIAESDSHAGNGLQQHLLIDADDTLWENNIFFERATEAFIDFLAHSSLTPREVRAVLDEFEHTMGYGSANFTKSLVETYKRLAEHDIREEDLAQVRSFGEQINHHPMQVIAGVPETLEYLSPRHHLVLLTKGHMEEQKLKIENSGLGSYFKHTRIAEEKNIDTYAGLVGELRLDRAKTWMIGNSPRSDINPALAAGLNAVYVPHSHTWHLEQEEILHEGKGRLLRLNSFVELRGYF